MEQRLADFCFQHCQPGFQTRRWVFLGGVHVCGHGCACLQACSLCSALAVVRTWSLASSGSRLQCSSRLRTCGRQYPSSCSTAVGQCWEGVCLRCVARRRKGALLRCCAACLDSRAKPVSLDTTACCCRARLGDCQLRRSLTSAGLQAPALRGRVQWGHCTAVIGDCSKRWANCAPAQVLSLLACLCAGERRSDKG